MTTENQNFGRPKKLWIQLVRRDQNDTDPPTKLKDVTIAEDMDSDFIKMLIREEFELRKKDEQKLIMKLRNHRGSLIPINGAISANSKSVPYLLETVKVFQNVQPKPRTVKMPGYDETVKNRLQSILSRIDKLEGNMPELKERREVKLVGDMEELERKLTFLNKRFEQADSHSWSGMFKRHPMW